MNLSCAAKANISDTNERSDAPENCNFQKWSISIIRAPLKKFYGMVTTKLPIEKQWAVKPIKVATIFSFLSGSL